MCARNPVGFKIVDGKSTQFLSTDDVIKNNQAFVDNLELVKQKYPEVDIDAMVKNFLFIVNTDSETERKYVPGNIVEITTRKVVQDKTSEHVEAMNYLLNAVSDPKLRNIYNEVIPGLGDILYKKYFNLFITHRFNLKMFHPFKSENTKFDMDSIRLVDDFFMKESLWLYLDMLLALFGVDEESIKNTNIDNTSIDYYGFFEFIKQKMLPIVTSDQMSAYQKCFSYLPNGGDFFDLVVKLVNTDYVSNFENENLLDLSVFKNTL